MSAALVEEPIGRRWRQTESSRIIECSRPCESLFQIRRSPKDTRGSSADTESEPRPNPTVRLEQRRLLDRSTQSDRKGAAAQEGNPNSLGPGASQTSPGMQA